MSLVVVGIVVFAVIYALWRLWIYTHSDRLEEAPEPVIDEATLYDQAFPIVEHINTVLGLPKELQGWFLIHQQPDGSWRCEQCKVAVDPGMHIDFHARPQRTWQEYAAGCPPLAEVREKIKETTR